MIALHASCFMQKTKNMKTLKLLVESSALIITISMLMSCEQKVTVESIVHPDGAIDRTLILTEVDSNFVQNNMFGITPNDGWKTTMEISVPSQDENVSKNSEKKYIIRFNKHFASTEEANKAMNSPNDTIFKINSAFDKEFHWFYTYLKYSDTYLSINRFRHFPKEEYFTKEDYDFINRMPADGKSISKGDSVYLDLLTEKVGEYFSKALFEEHFVILLEAIEKNKIDRRWVDSLQRYKGMMYSTLSKNEKEKEMDEAFMIPLLQELNIGFPVNEIAPEYLQKYPALKSRVNFMTQNGAEVKFTHHIKMPWKIITANADSINGTSLFWRPMNIKFMLNDFTMSAESRKLNYWAVLISALVVVGTIAVLISRRTAKF